METKLDVQFQVFEKTGQPFQFNEKELPFKLKSGEVLVKIKLATICASDVHTIDGKRIEDTPCVLGHEGIGEIVAVNSREGFSVGDRITWTIMNSCGECAPCKEYNLPEKCNQLFKYGHASIHKGSGLNGCYASHIHLRKGTHIVKIPNTVKDAVAVPANCALATMVNAVSQMHVTPKSVVVQGGGLLGLYACGLLHEMGVSQIFCLEINENRFELIKQFGAIPVIATNIEKANQRILDQFEDGVDVVFEVAGIKELIPQGITLLRPGGAYILVGLVHPDSKMEITAEQIIRKCAHIKGVHNYSAQHLDEAIAFLDRNRNNFPFDKLVSPPFKLKDLEEAVKKSKQQNWMRVSIKPN